MGTKKYVRLEMNMSDSEERRKSLIKLYEERDKIKDDIKNNGKKEFNNYFKDLERNKFKRYVL